MPQKQFSSLFFGTAGIPLRTPQPKYETALPYLKQLGLHAMELEFVHSINISKEKAPLIKQLAKENEIVLTSHGQYYINLNALEQEKVNASIQRVVNAATRAYEAGAVSMTFHAAFYLKQDPQKVYDTVKKHMKTIISQLQEQHVDIWVRPETTGKSTQFGSFEELLQLSSELEMVEPCFDFAHLHARTNGKYNSYEETMEVLDAVEYHLGKQALKRMHIHMSGIAYSEKGERNHLTLEESDLNYKEILRAWKEKKIKGIVISESPNIEEDALLMQKVYEQ